MPERRRFPPPWTVEELDACFVVADHNSLPMVYYEEVPGRRIEQGNMVIGPVIRTSKSIPKGIRGDL